MQFWRICDKKHAYTTYSIITEAPCLCNKNLMTQVQDSSRYIIHAITVIPAVSVRRIRLPSVTGFMPYAIAACSSDSSKPPSGP